MSRIVQGAIKWARAIERPKSIPQGRARGKKAYGVRYEKACAGRIAGVVQGQWFEYADQSGRYFCQTDLLFRRGPLLAIAECKYSWTLEGFQQLEGLYLPVLRAYAPAATIVGFQICRRLAAGPKAITVVGDIAAALAACTSGRRWVTLHWLGKSALEPGNGEGPSAPTPTIAPAALGL